MSSYYIDYTALNSDVRNVLFVSVPLVAAVAVNWDVTNSLVYTLLEQFNYYIHCAAFAVSKLCHHGRDRGDAYLVSVCNTLRNIYSKHSERETCLD
jgi:hypothetical protein